MMALPVVARHCDGAHKIVCTGLGWDMAHAQEAAFPTHIC